MKVRALRTVYYADARMRGDDTLGPGNGVVFELIPRQTTEYDVIRSREVFGEDGKQKMITITAEQQFSGRNMVVVPDDTPETYVTAQDALTIENDKLSPVRGKRRIKAN